MFSFSELLILLDVDGVPPMTAPFPTLEEVAPLVGELKFATSMAHLLPPRRAHLSASPIAVEVTLADFPWGSARALWEHLHGYVTSYLEDTLSKVPKRDALPHYRTYKGHGVTVLYAYTPPNHDEPCLELKLLRDEHPLQTIATVFGISREVLATPLDRNWRTLPSTRDMHVEASSVGDELRLRCNAPLGPGSVPPACSSWTTFWLQWWSPFGGGTSRSELRDRPLAEHEHATEFAIGKDPVVLIRGSTTRRAHFEVHVPLRWITGDRASRDRTSSFCRSA